MKRRPARLKWSSFCPKGKAARRPSPPTTTKRRAAFTPRRRCSSSCKQCTRRTSPRRKSTNPPNRLQHHRLDGPIDQFALLIDWRLGDAVKYIQTFDDFSEDAVAVLVIAVATMIQLG